MANRIRKYNYQLFRLMFFTLSVILLFSLYLGCSKNSSIGNKSQSDASSENESKEKEEMAVKVFFLEGAELAYEERTIFFNMEKPSEKINKALEALIEGPKERLTPTLSNKTKLLNAFIDEEGVAYLNFSKDIIKNNPGGTFSELAAINSIVHTVVENFDEVSAVQILISGKEVNTLLGHIDTSKPFKLKGFYETNIKQ